MNKLDKAYTDLLQDILDNGTTKMDRTGTGTISVFGRQIRHNMKDGFPLLTTKKMPFKTITTELIWFLRGDTNIKYLVDNNCHIWDGDAYKKYLKNFTPPICPPTLDVQPDYYEPMSKGMFIYGIKTDDEFAKKWGELGPIYGKQWRSWNTNAISRRSSGTLNEDGIVENMTFIEDSPIQIDQIANLISDLKTNPDSRRLMVNAWNVGELDQMTLPPCHYGFQVYTRELSLDERYKLANINNDKENLPGEPNYTEEQEHSMLDELNIPTRAISLMWNQRSVDTFLGLPFNIASYGLLLEIIAKAVNMIPDELIGNLGDVHLYSNHIEQAKEQIGRGLSLEERRKLWVSTGMGWKEEVSELLQIQEYNCRFIPTRTREPFPLPTLKINRCPITGISIDYLSISQFEVENYQSHPTIKAPLSN